MKKSVSKMSFVVLAVLLLVASVIPIALASPANPFRRMANTESGHATWDSDIINIEAVSETGDEIYVAVLDTGLAPNWRDYFPKDRILTNLGKGFIQPLSFEWVEDVLNARTGGPVY
jgi:hypothetical protein